MSFSISLELWHVVVASTGLCWLAAARIPHETLNPFNSVVAFVLFLAPLVFWGAFFIGRSS